MPSTGGELHPIFDSKIPFIPGLQMTRAWGRPSGDVEEINMLSDLKPEAYRMSTSALTFIDDNDLRGKQETNDRDSHTVMTISGKTRQIDSRGEARFVSTSCGNIKPGDPEVD